MSIRSDIAAVEADGSTRQLSEAADGKSAGGAPNDFYALWLDRRLVYSCASFHSPDEDLDTAQRHRLDNVCSMLRLRPGQRLLDVSCGWGGLVMHAVERFGADATGVTLSRAQADLANQRLAANPRITASGLAGQRVQVRHYRRVDAPRRATMRWRA